MLYNIIFAFIIIISVAAIVFIISKKMPDASEVKNLTQNASASNGLKFDSKKILNIFISWCERIFRRVKIWSLKLDTKISKWLKKLHNIKKKNTFFEEKIEQDSSVLMDNAEKVHYSQLKNVMPSPQIKKDVDLAHILGEKQKKTLSAETEAETEIEEVEFYTEEECIGMISKNPRNIKAYHMLADIYIRQKNLNDARASLQQILKFAANNVDAKMKLRKIRELQNKEK